MDLNLKGFGKQLTIFSIVLFALYGALVIVLPSRFVSDLYWAFVPFFYVVILVSRIAMAEKGKRKKSFDITFISTTVIRFILYVSILLFYSFRRPDDAVPFIITFFVFYFAFTLFEVSYMYRDLKTRNN